MHRSSRSQTLTNSEFMLLHGNQIPTMSSYITSHYYLQHLEQKTISLTPRPSPGNYPIQSAPDSLSPPITRPQRQSRWHLTAILGLLPLQEAPTPAMSCTRPRECSRFLGPVGVPVVSSEANSCECCSQCRYAERLQGGPGLSSWLAGYRLGKIGIRDVCRLRCG